MLLLKQNKNMIAFACQIVLPSQKKSKYQQKHYHKMSQQAEGKLPFLMVKFAISPRSA